MRKIRTRILELFTAAAIALTMVSFIPLPVAAQITGGGNQVDQGLGSIGGAFPNTGLSQPRTWQAWVATVINYALYLAGILAVIFIIYGGFQYITSRGNETQAKSGARTLTYAVIGLVLIILSYVIINVLVSFLTT
jgi:hypothetical protein